MKDPKQTTNLVETVRANAGRLKRAIPLETLEDIVGGMRSDREQCKATGDTSMGCGGTGDG